jgi:hypothetical protein
MAAPRDSEERDRIMNDGYTANLVAYFRRHKKVVKAAYAAASDTVRTKYRFLAKYHNEIVKEHLPNRRDLRIKW